MLPFGFGDIDLNQLMRMLQSGGPVNWEIAAQVATPRRDRRRARASRRHRGDRPSSTSSPAPRRPTSSPRPASARRSRRGSRPPGGPGWVDLHLEALKPVLEALATTLGPGPRGGATRRARRTAPPATRSRPVMPMLAPLLLGVQAGLDDRLPRPARRSAATTCRCPPRIRRRCASWSRTSTRSRRPGRSSGPICGSRSRCTRSSTPRRGRCRGCGSGWSAWPPTTSRPTRSTPSCCGPGSATSTPPNPEALQNLAERPEELLGAMTSPRQEEMLDPRCGGSTRCSRATPTRSWAGSAAGWCRRSPAIHEAMARHRLERGEASRFVEQLLGPDPRARRLRAGRGVLRRASSSAPAPDAAEPVCGRTRAWCRPPPSSTAPGLWLARIELDLP